MPGKWVGGLGGVEMGMRGWGWEAVVGRKERQTERGRPRVCRHAGTHAPPPLGASKKLMEALSMAPKVVVTSWSASFTYWCLLCLVWLIGWNGGVLVREGWVLNRIILHPDSIRLIWFKSQAHRRAQRGYEDAACLGGEEEARGGGAVAVEPGKGADL